MPSVVGVQNERRRSAAPIVKTYSPREFSFCAKNGVLSFKRLGQNPRAAMAARALQLERNCHFTPPISSALKYANKAYFEQMRDAR
jgi:hypothetical protein